MALSPTDRVNLIGTWIDDVSMDEAIARIEALIPLRSSALVVTPNVDHLIKLRQDPEFRRVYEAADLVLADGQPLIWAAQLLGTPLKEKVSGSDLFVRFAPVAAAGGHRLFFMGGQPGAAERAADVLKAKHPGLTVCGTACPPYGFETHPEQNAALLETIRAAEPDVLFVGLGAPKQEKWLYAHREALQVPVSIGVGASFDFVAGLVRRAPRPLPQLGLEWGWRLLMEPRRLWRRYLVEDSRFLLDVSRQLRGTLDDPAT
jgi:N-acetylglucosaminyldiphosphoundecaprenol N-acetyl-beta-D-mannosaminyltransferase